MVVRFQVSFDAADPRRLARSTPPSTAWSASAPPSSAPSTTPTSTGSSCGTPKATSSASNRKLGLRDATLGGLLAALAAGAGGAGAAAGVAGAVDRRQRRQPAGDPAPRLGDAGPEGGAVLRDPLPGTRGPRATRDGGRGQRRRSAGARRRGRIPDRARAPRHPGAGGGGDRGSGLAGAGPR